LLCELPRPRNAGTSMLQIGWFEIGWDSGLGRLSSTR
jgi:hypothetical protein